MDVATDEKCKKHLKKLLGLETQLPSPTEAGPERRRLIISSGDISDVDGFFALAEYSKVFNSYPFLCILNNLLCLHQANAAGSLSLLRYEQLYLNARVGISFFL